MTTVATGWWGQHGVHALTIGGPVLVFALIAVGADLRAWMKRRQPHAGLPLMHFAAGLSVVAGAIHFGVFPHHLQAGWLYGAFFAASATAQLIWAAGALLRAPAWWLPAGVLGNAAIVMLWAVTRTLGVPLGPSAGLTEPVGVLDVACGLAEVGIVVICAVVLARQRRHTAPTNERLRVVAP